MQLIPLHQTIPVNIASMISGGSVILYPTDTLYALGADALADEAVDRVYAIKGRDERKPMHAIVADLAMAERYAYVDDIARILARHFLPGPLTLILKKKEGVDTGIARGIDTFGIRIPDNAWCIDLVRTFDRPITTTSANRSGEIPARSPAGILAQLGDRTHDIGYVIDGGELPERAPSTIVDCSGERPIILREGAIAADEIWQVLVELED